MTTPNDSNGQRAMTERPAFRPIPTWESFYAVSPGELEAIGELPWLSDRAAAIVGTVLLENCVRRLLRRHFAHLQVRALDELFEIRGPLATFSAQIQIAHGLGFISDEGRRDLDLIRKIRNEFAHAIAAHSFADEPIASFCREIKLVDVGVQDMPEFGPQAPPTGLRSGLIFAGATEALKDPRARFFLSINLFSGLFAITGSPTAKARPHF